MIIFMKKILPIVIIIVLFSQGISKPIGIRDLHLKADGLYYSSYTDTPFTGIVSGPYTEVIHHYNENTLVKRNIQGKIIDTTGAGDIYAGGFIHGLINNYSLKRCGEVGSICAGQIITELGSRTKMDLQELIRNNLH